MAGPDKERIGAERLESPERFVRNSLVGFSGNDCRDAPQGARAGGAGGTEKEGAAVLRPYTLQDLNVVKSGSARGFARAGWGETGFA